MLQQAVLSDSGTKPSPILLTNLKQWSIIKSSCLWESPCGAETKGQESVQQGCWGQLLAKLRNGHLIDRHCLCISLIGVFVWSCAFGCEGLISVEMTSSVLLRPPSSRKRRTSSLSALVFLPCWLQRPLHWDPARLHSFCSVKPSVNAQQHSPPPPLWTPSHVVVSYSAGSAGFLDKMTPHVCCEDENLGISCVWTLSVKP